MPNFTIVLSKNAQKSLDKLSDNTAEPIIEAIARLASDPRPNGCKKLKGRDGYRIRVGNYRVIYEIFDSELIIDVVALGIVKIFMNETKEGLTKLISPS